MDNRVELLVRYARNVEVKNSIPSVEDAASFDSRTFRSVSVSLIIIFVERLRSRANYAPLRAGSHKGVGLERVGFAGRDELAVRDGASAAPYGGGRRFRARSRVAFAGGGAL